MSLNGSAQRFRDDLDDADAEKVNSLEMGGNVSQSNVGGLKVDVSAIRGLIGGVEVSYAGDSEVSVTTGVANYVYIDDTGALQVDTVGFPTYGTGSGEELYFPLAIVTCAASTITSIADRRWRFSV